MLNQRKELRRQVVEILSMEELVPGDHLLRQVDGAVDFIRIYDFVEEQYCKGNGRPSVDPVVLFKIVMIQHLFGIPSLRRTDGRSQSQCGIPMVFGLCLQRRAAAFFNGEL